MYAFYIYSYNIDKRLEWENEEKAWYLIERIWSLIIIIWKMHKWFWFLEGGKCKNKKGTLG